MSDDVSIVTSTSPGVNSPRVKPPIASVKADDEMGTPAVVITKKVGVMALHEAVKLKMLLAPGVTKGVIFVAKKEDG